MDAAVLWLGSPRPPQPWARRLAAAGLALVEITEPAAMPAVLRAMTPGVVMLAPGTDVRGVLLEAVGGQSPAKIIAVAADQDAALTAMMAGAQDAILVSTGEDEMALRVTALVRIAERERKQAGALAAVADRIHELEQRVKEVERERDQLKELAHRDELTSLGNRRSFFHQLEWSLAWADRYGGEVSVVLVDLDGMKALNDRAGHAAGDAALRLVAQAIRASLRNTDHAARLGGDEFGVVMPRTRASEAARVAERMRLAVAEIALPASIVLTGCFGVASRALPKGVGFAGDELVARADAALYAAKRAGKNRVVVDGAAVVPRSAA